MMKQDYRGIITYSPSVYVINTLQNSCALNRDLCMTLGTLTVISIRICNLQKKKQEITYGFYNLGNKSDKNDSF